MNNTILIIIIAAVIALGFGVVIAIINRKFKEFKDENKKDAGLQMLNQSLQGMQARLDNTQRAISERLDKAASVIGVVGKELGQLQEVGSQMRQFQEFLKSPKMRGGLGEQGLKDILAQSLPTQYFRIQHKFRTGDTVDAAIKIETGIIPVDAKFPLENFNQMIKAAEGPEKILYQRQFKRDFKVHVDAIRKKYILPDEGTTDFAMMYLPSESIFFEVVNNQPELFEYAYHNKIIVASPSTFLYYLRTIMLGLEGKRIEQMSRQILQVLKTIKQESQRFGEDLGVLSRHIYNTKNSMDTVQTRYTRLQQKIETVDLLESEEQLKLPQEE